MEYRHDAAKGWLSTEITQWRRTFFNIAAKRTLKTLSLPFEVTSGGMQRNPWLPYEKSHQKCSTWCSMRILACRIVHIEDVAIYRWESPGDSSLWAVLVSLSLSCLWGLGFPFCLSEACWAWVLLGFGAYMLRAPCSYLCPSLLECSREKLPARKNV